MERVQTPGKKVKGDDLYANLTLVFGPASYVPSDDSFMDYLNSYNDGRGGMNPSTQKRYLENIRRDHDIKYMNKLAQKYGYRVDKI